MKTLGLQLGTYWFLLKAKLENGSTLITNDVEVKDRSVVIPWALDERIFQFVSVLPITLSFIPFPIITMQNNI